MAERARILGATLENFGPVQCAEYPLADLGLTLVEGRNLDDPDKSPSNGSGKSTFFLDGPTWTAFGRSRAVSADDVINETAGKDCAGTLRLHLPDIGRVTVQRFRKVAGKSGVRLWVGTHVTDLADAKDPKHAAFEVTKLDPDATQVEIEHILGLDLDVWRAAVYRAQDDDARFAALSDGKQKELLTRIFQLDEIDAWRSSAGEAAKALSDELRALEVERDHLLTQDFAKQASAIQADEVRWWAERDERLESFNREYGACQQAWREAKTRCDRARAITYQLSQLPQPAVPHEEPTPSRPVEPPLSLPAAPQRAQLSGNDEAVRLEAEAANWEYHSGIATERARASSEAGWKTTSRAEKIRDQRQGQCSECASPLTPEHADRESQRLFAEAAVHVEAMRREEAKATEANAEARKLRNQIAAYRQNQAAEQARLNEQFRQADATWKQQVAGLQAARRQQYDAQLSAWQQAAQAVVARNAATRANAFGAYNTQVAALTAEFKALGSAEFDIERIQREGSAKAVERDRLASQVWPRAGEVQALEQRAAEREQQLAALAEKIIHKQHELALADFWNEGFGPRGLKSWVLDERVQELTDRTNAWLRILTGGVYWIRAESQSVTQKGKLIDKFSIRVFRHKPLGGIAERSWFSWSGGQRGRVGIGIDLALADTVAARARRSYDLLVMDEVSRGLDAGGLEALLEALKVLRRERGSVVVVEHESQFRAAFERKIRIEMKGESSTLHAER